MPSATTPKVDKIRPFERLNPKDQQLKQTKKLCIEQNWQCKIEECLPQSIRPRMEPKKGAKLRVDDKATQDEKWWNWSVELLKAVEELSSMTEGDLPYARELFEAEVESRQNNPKSSQRKIVELLLGDAQRVVDEQRKRLAVKYTADSMVMAGEPVDQQYNQLGFPQTFTRGTKMIGHPPNNSLVHYQSDIQKDTPDPDYPDAHLRRSQQTMPGDELWVSSDTAPRSTLGKRPAPSSDESNDNVRGHLRAAELKARVARLRAQAVRVEADALEIEVECRELQETLEEEQDA